MHLSLKWGATVGWLSQFDCYWVGSADVWEIKGFPLNPQKVKLLGSGSAATRPRDLFFQLIDFECMGFVKSYFSTWTLK